MWQPSGRVALLESAVLIPKFRPESRSPKLRTGWNTSADTLHRVLITSLQGTAPSPTPASPRKRLVVRRLAPRSPTPVLRGLQGSPKPMHAKSRQLSYERPQTGSLPAGPWQAPLKLYCPRRVLCTPTTKRRPKNPVGLLARGVRRGVGVKTPVQRDSLSFSQASSSYSLLLPKFVE